MFDKDFDEPNYDIGGYSDYEENSSEGGTNIISKLKPLIILGVIVVIVAVAIMMFLGMQQEVTINIENVTGGIVSDASLSISSGGNRIYGPEMGATHKLTLSNGTYDYVISSSDYELKQGSFEVSAENNKETIKLTKDIQADLRFDTTITKIYAGQNLTGQITIDNIETPIKNERIVVSDDEDLLKIVLTPEKITASAGATGVTFTISVNEEIDSPQETKITAKIQGTLIGDSLDIIVYPTVEETELIISQDFDEESGLIENDLTAGKEEIYELEIKNESEEVNLSDLKLEIVADSGYEEELDWLEFANYNGTTKTENIIEKIEAEKSKTIQLYVEPQKTSKIGDSFKGKLVLSSDSLETKKEYIINLIVDEAAEVSLELSERDFDSKCTPDCETIRFAGNDNVTLNNKGSASANKIEISADESINSYDYCSMWMEIKTTEIDTIEADGEKSLNIDITPEYHGEDEYLCYLNFEFDNPTTGERESMLSKAIVINLDYDVDE
jgi:hypothetical protein